MEKLIRVEVMSVIEDDRTQSPIVILYDKKDDRILPIWIGDPEARAIAVALEDAPTPRPLTHDLILDIIEGLSAKLSHVVVDKVDDGTYYASLYLEIERAMIQIDARPSDSIAIAITAQAPIYVEPAVMKRGGQKNPFPELGASGQTQEGPRAIRLSKEDLDRIASMLRSAQDREQSS